MTLQEFRASRVHVAIAEAIADHPHIGDLSVDPAIYPFANLYADGAYILQGSGGFYLLIELDEYCATDLPLLEFVLWCFLSDSPEAQAANAAIWASPAPALTSRVPA